MPKKVKFYADMPTKSGRSVMVNVSGLKVERFIEWSVKPTDADRLGGM